MDELEMFSISKFILTSFIQNFKVGFATRLYIANVKCHKTSNLWDTQWKFLTDLSETSDCIDHDLRIARFSVHDFDNVF